MMPHGMIYFRERPPEQGQTWGGGVLHAFRFWLPEGPTEGVAGLLRVTRLNGLIWGSWLGIQFLHDSAF
jgi:hypothetical protein